MIDWEKFDCYNIEVNIVIVNHSIIVGNQLQEPWTIIV